MPARAGLVANTSDPVPVSSEITASRLAEVSLIEYPANVVGVEPEVARPYVSTVSEVYVPQL